MASDHEPRAVPDEPPEDGGAAGFGSLLRAHRLAAGLTQEALAERAGLSTRGIQSLERGARRPYRDTLARLARALALAPDARARFAAAAQPGLGPRIDADPAPGTRPPGAGRITYLFPERGRGGPAEGAWDAPPAVLHNLPAAVSRFVGRQKELAEVRQRLAAQRLVTLTGPAGVGKTRLALEIAGGLADEPAPAPVAPGSGTAPVEATEVAALWLPDGVWLVELAALADPARLPAAVAAAVGVQQVPGQPPVATLGAALRARDLLLVLDNCEHLIEAAARLAESLLRACPRLRILATSREPLGLAGEVTYRVPSLAVPPPGPEPPVEQLADYDAVRLFVDRAEAALPGFVIRPENASAVAQLCRHLDGLPLAIELAAARVRALSVEQVLARLADRFRLLTGGSRAALARHQTLRAAVDWSYDLLPDRERLLFDRLSVFAGGWTLEAAEAVCADEDEGRKTRDEGRERAGIRPPSFVLGRDDILDLLAHLVDRSLVVVDPQPDGTARYRFLETLRQYAWERLAAGSGAARVQDRHAAHALALAEQVAPALHGPAQAAALDRLERELDNVRAALAWAETSRRAETGLRLATALLWFWWRRHPEEGGSWLARLLELPAGAGGAAPPAVRARALSAAGYLAACVGDLEAARGACEAGLALARQTDDRPALAAATFASGWVANEHGEHLAARPLLEAAVGLYEATGDWSQLALALRGLARIAAAGHKDAEAAAHFMRALALYRRVGDHSGAAGVLRALGYLARDRADYSTARDAFAASLAHFREGGDAAGGASAQEGLARLALLEGDLAAACAGFATALRDFRAVGLRRAGVRTLGWLAAVAAAESRWEHALRLAGAAAALPVGQDPGRPVPDWADLERIRTQASAALSASAAAVAWAAGQAMSLEHAVAYALEDAPVAP